MLAHRRSGTCGLSARAIPLQPEPVVEAVMQRIVGLWRVLAAKRAAGSRKPRNRKRYFQFAPTQWATSLDCVCVGDQQLQVLRNGAAKRAEALLLHSRVSHHGGLASVASSQRQCMSLSRGRASARERG